MSALDHALQLHGQGRLDEARQAYLDILSHAPEADDALHYLGILEHQSGPARPGSICWRAPSISHRRRPRG